MLLFNTLTQKKELFTTLEKNKVLLYVCGITPYDTTHLGHAFLYVFFDAFTRYLSHKGYDVHYVQNVTDIDDDILKRAKEEGKDWRVLGDFWTRRFLDDYRALNMNLPTKYVKATETISTIIEMVQDIISKGYGYEKEGNVYFEVSKFKDYGKLSRLSPKQMIPVSRERGNNTEDPHKKNPLDFILWQRSQDTEPFWDSPWGKGRPGWHIECSAMAYKHLGKQIDIHGGGMDLVYPHHESEIAQSESFTGKTPFASYWTHAEMLKYRDEKMSKSLGNMIFVSDLLKKYSASSIRFVLLSHHYRQVWEFEDREMERAAESMNRLEKQLKDYDRGELPEIEKFLDDDMDTSSALSYMEKEMSGGALRAAMKLLGFAV